MTSETRNALGRQAAMSGSFRHNNICVIIFLVTLLRLKEHIQGDCHMADSVKKIRLNDLLRLPENGDIKVKFCKYNGESNPIDEYLEDHERANSIWVAWRGKRASFHVGQVVLLVMRMKSGLELLTSIRKVTADTGVPESHAYSTEELEEFRQYYGRIVLESPDPPIGQTYIQFYSSVVDRLFVHEILPERFSGQTFPGMNNIRIRLGELKSLNEHHRQDWLLPLSTQKGIYMITDTETNERYVGSAYGENGIWQRWMTYVYTDGHGNNVELYKVLKEKGADYSLKNFEFTVLETFGFGTDDQTIIHRENWWKETLHTRQELNKN